MNRLIRRTHRLPCQLLENIIHCSNLKLPFQFIGRIESTDHAIHHDRDTVAILGLIHEVGGNKDSDPPVGSLINKLPELATGSRIYPTRRLIQKDDLRLVKDGNGESKFLFPAQRQTFTSVSRSALSPMRSKSSSVLRAISSSAMP